MTNLPFKLKISGYGLITPLGASSWETFSSILSGQTLAKRARKLEEDYSPVDVTRQVGCIKFAQHSKLDPSIIIGERAGREALLMATGSEKLPETPMPCILAASKGAMHTLTEAFNFANDLQLGTCMPQHYPTQQPEDVTLVGMIGPHGYLAHHLSKRLNLSIIKTVVAACTSSLMAIHEAKLYLERNEDADRIMVISAEAALLPMFVHSYEKLGVLPPLNRHEYGGYPLDQSKQGFMLSEMGGAIIIEKTDKITKGQTELTKTAIANQGIDLMRSEPDMLGLKHVAKEIFDHSEINMIHPHATGTNGEDDHDVTELGIYENLLSEQCKDIGIFANKGAIGHGLGASGMSSVVLACICAKSNTKPPMPWLENPIASKFNLIKARKSDESIKYDNHAIFASGFGGHVAGVSIRYQR